MRRLVAPSFDSQTLGCSNSRPVRQLIHRSRLAKSPHAGYTLAMNIRSERLTMPTTSTAAIPIRLYERLVFPSLDGAAQLAWSLLGLKTLIGLSAPILVLTEKFDLLALFLAVAIIADILDGWVFGKSGLASCKDHRDRRRIIDTITDRFLIAATIAPLFFSGHVPATFLALVVARELAVYVVTVVPYLAKRFICRPNLPSRIGTALVGVQTILLSLGVPLLSELLVVLTIVTLLGLWQYRYKPRTN